MAPLSFNDIDRKDYQSTMIAIYELNDIHEDLEHISPARIAGLGISIADLDAWLMKK